MHQKAHNCSESFVGEHPPAGVALPLTSITRVEKGKN